MTPATIDVMLERVAAVLKRFGATEVYVFGSFADGTAGDQSDVDIAVRGISADRFYRAAGAASLDVGRTFDMLDLDVPTPLADFLRDSGALRRVA